VPSAWAETSNGHLEDPFTTRLRRQKSSTKSQEEEEEEEEENYMHDIVQEASNREKTPEWVARVVVYPRSVRLFRPRFLHDLVTGFP